MAGSQEILRSVHRSAAKKVLFLPHAVRQMSRLDRMISPQEVQTVIEKGELIENYPNDSRGHSCLILGQGKDMQPIHVVCSPKGDFLAIITAYIPSESEWKNHFRERRKT